MKPSSDAKSYVCTKSAYIKPRKLLQEGYFEGSICTLRHRELDKNRFVTMKDVQYHGTKSIVSGGCVALNLLVMRETWRL